jgi:OLD-like protein
MEGGLANRDQKRAWRRARREAVPGGGPQATRHALARAGDARAIVLVEGISDQIALETLAARRGRNLDAEGVLVVPIGGAHALGRFLTRFGPQGSDTRVAGLCDAGEEEVFRRSLERAGFGSDLTRVDMERLGFHVCVEDLEDELIRALGPAAVEAVVDSQGDLGSFRTFQKQPAWREQNVEGQLRRFLGSADRRKIRYPRLLVDALDLAQVPRPLDGVLAHV